MRFFSSSDSAHHCDSNSSEQGHSRPLESCACSEALCWLSVYKSNFSDRNRVWTCPCIRSLTHSLSHNLSLVNFQIQFWRSERRLKTHWLIVHRRDFHQCGQPTWSVWRRDITAFNRELATYRKHYVLIDRLALVVRLPLCHRKFPFPTGDSFGLSLGRQT